MLLFYFLSTKEKKLASRVNFFSKKSVHIQDPTLSGVCVAPHITSSYDHHVDIINGIKLKRIAKFGVVKNAMTFIPSFKKIRKFVQNLLGETDT
jgi:hypothetical protein